MQNQKFFFSFSFLVGTNDDAYFYTLLAAGQKKIDGFEKEIEKTLERLMNTENEAVMRRYEQHIAELEKLEPLLKFLANPWKRVRSPCADWC